jgi:hypothetical protein
MKQYVDNKSSFRQFAVGDSVYLKLQPYIQTSLATRSSNKLSFRYFGPFKITDKIGSVAYKLALPDSSSIHPVFHVSQLKKAIAASHQVSTELPDPSIQLQVPLRVLDRRLHRQLDQVIPQVLIQWTNLPPQLSTWEDEEALRQDFPWAPAWGQAVSQEGEIVTSAGTAAEDHEDQVEEGAPLDDGPRDSKRASKPNKRYIWPDWA